MASGDSPVGDSIPDLTEQQYEALREYTKRHRQVEGQFAPHPCLLARVVAGDKPAACVDPVAAVVPEGYADSDDYLPDVFGRMGVHPTQIANDDSWHVSRTEWRLDLLPNEASYSDAYHRRCGVFYGYPKDAIEWFINESLNITATHSDVARSGVIPPEDMAYLIFVSYSHRRELDQYRELINRGKAIRRRIDGLSRAWDLPGLAAHADDVYDDCASVYAGNGGSFDALSVFPPDVDVTKKDVRKLLS